MSPHPEEILHDAMDGREVLQLGGGLEAAHLTFARLGRLMRHLGAVVRILIRPVDHGRHHRSVRGRVTAELVEAHEEVGGCVVMADWLLAPTTGA